MTVLPAFFSPGEVAELRALAESTHEGWVPGRQHTGYEILTLRSSMPLASPFVARGMAHIGTPFEDYWDVYFIRYLDGAYIPPHTDPAQHGRSHRRLNAVLTQATSGGALLVAGEPVTLGVGDAVVFSPDRVSHEVTRVGGTRLLFSVGAWI
jgi:hypothetical protein